MTQNARIVRYVILVFLLSLTRNIYAQNQPSSSRPLGGWLSSGDARVTMESSVSYDEATGIYTYEYKIKNTGSKYCLFQWGILDRVLSWRYNFPHIFEMEPSKEYRFTIKSKEKPVTTSEYVNMFRKKEAGKGADRILEELGVDASEYGFWVLSPGSSMEGYLPPSFLKNLGEK